MKLTLGATGVMVAVALFLCAPAEAQDVPALFKEPLSPRIANYNIDVRLDVAGKKLEGAERLLWINKSKDSIHELQFHLYLNGFRNSRSTFMKEAGPRSWPDEPDGWGYSDVRAVQVSYVNGGAATEQFFTAGANMPESAARRDLTAAMHFIHPDDDNAEDKSVFAVPLPRPLRPGASILVYLEFEARLPEPPVARTGARKEFFFVGQWFPKIGVYTDSGWNTHQFHANSEFFADFGVYNVRMTVPATHVLGATGLLVSRTENDDGTATHFYHAEDVHDFAWASSPEFKEFTGKAQDVDIRVLLQPDHAGQAERHLRAAKLAIETFQNRFGDYPFPNLTLVDPRRGAGEAGGMEYPTLIATVSKYGLPEGVKWIEDVIIHEFGHNYWYHLLASNEFEESWMDEGINTYTDILVSELANQPLIDIGGLRIDYQVFNRAGISGGDPDPIIRRAWNYYSRRSYGVNSYSKPGLVLTTLSKVLGDSTMQKIMRAYVARWRFKHPRSQDFFDIVNEVSNRDMSSFIHQAFYTKAAFDYTVASVFTRKLKAPEGIDFTLNTASADSELTDAVGAMDSVGTRVDTPDDISSISTAETDSLLADTAREEAPQMYESGVNVRRLEDFSFPVEVEVVFDDGEVFHESWDGKELWKKFRYVRPARLVSATVDPERKIWIDRNFTNNSRTVKTQTLGVNKLSARAMFWLQFALEQPEVLLLTPLFKNYLP